jgi:hypothetical protein
LKKETQLLLGFEEDDEEIEWSEDLYDALRALWSDEGVAAAYKRANEFQLSDSTH